jgi:uncharacterized damage-inducible protein DinB
MSGGANDEASHLIMLTQYNAWADMMFFSAMNSLPAGEAVKERVTRFKNMVHTMNHVYVIDSVFKAHLLGQAHNFTARNTVEHPPLPELWDHKMAIDQWYVDYARSLSGRQLAERVDFQFIGGGDGVMTRREIILHIVTHGSYHRGFIADMMYHVPAKPPVADLTVYLRDVVQKQG